MNELTPIPQPSAADVLLAIDQAELADGSRMIYRAALQKMLDAGVDYTDAVNVRRYGRDLRPHEQIALRSALKHVGEHQIWLADSMAGPDNIDYVLSLERRWEAVRKAIRTQHGYLPYSRENIR